MTANPVYINYIHCLGGECETYSLRIEHSDLTVWKNFAKDVNYCQVIRVCEVGVFKKYKQKSN